jgi:UDP-glucose 4-epimerase
MASCLVSGGAGFIGSHLAEKLCARGHKVRVFDDMSTGSPGNLGNLSGKVEIVEGSVCEPGEVLDAMAGAEYVFHEAAVSSVGESIKDPARTAEVNVEGTRNVLEAALGCRVRKAVLASSAAVYGNAEPPLKESMDTAPLSPYGKSKEAMEALGREYHSRGLPTVSLRYFNVYGPRQSAGSESGVIARFVDSMCRGDPPVIYGDGSQTRDFIYVADVAEANVLAMESRAADGRVLNVGSGRPTSINGLAETLAKLLGEEVGPLRKGTRDGDLVHSYADTSEAEKTLGFKARWSLEDGLLRTIRWRESL